MSIPPTPEAALTDQVLTRAIIAARLTQKIGDAPGTFNATVDDLAAMRKVLLAALAASPEPALNTDDLLRLARVFAFVTGSDVVDARDRRIQQWLASQLAEIHPPEPRETPADYEMAIRFYDRPGGPPGNGLVPVCVNCKVSKGQRHLTGCPIGLKEAQPPAPEAETPVKQRLVITDEGSPAALARKAIRDIVQPSPLPEPPAADVCPQCQGRGTVPSFVSPDPNTCPDCLGTGLRPEVIVASASAEPWQIVRAQRMDSSAIQPAETRERPAEPTELQQASNWCRTLAAELERNLASAVPEQLRQIADLITKLQPPPSSLALTALVEKWRQRAADRQIGNPDPGCHLQAREIHHCADDLEAMRDQGETWQPDKLIQEARDSERLTASDLATTVRAEGQE